MASAWVGPGGVAVTGAASLRFRHALLGTVAAGALSLAFGGPSLAGPLPAGCTISGGGTIETCTGDQHNGVVAAGPPVNTLNVNNLTTAITPASGTAGISFGSVGAVTITSNTGTFDITTAGNNASGIYAKGFGAGAIKVTSTGNISTAGSKAYGIYAKGFGTGAVPAHPGYLPPAIGSRSLRPVTSPPRASTRAGFLPFPFLLAL
jgi:hypothetical protein